MVSKKLIAIIIPAYNEAKAVGVVVKNIRKTFSNTDFDAHTIVIDDGSTDKTAKIAQKAGAKVISHIYNTGQGGAFATGLAYAKQGGYDLAATLDGDGQHDPKDVLRGIQGISKVGADLLIGSRLIEPRGMTKIKQLGNRGLTYITYTFFGVRVTDSQSGLRVFSNKAIENLRWRGTGYEVCSEMLWRAKQQGLKIDEFPIKAIYTDYSKSKGQNNWNAINIVKNLLLHRVMETFGE